MTWILVGVDRVFRTGSATGSASSTSDAFDAAATFESLLRVLLTAGSDFCGVPAFDDVRRVLRDVAGVVEDKETSWTFPASDFREFSGMGDNLIIDIAVVFGRLGVRIDGVAGDRSPASELVDLVRFRVEVSTGAGEVAVDEDFRILRLSSDFGVPVVDDFFSGVLLRLRSDFGVPAVDDFFSGVLDLGEIASAGFSPPS